MGTNIQSIVWARTIAALYGATVIQPSYRLAPEHKFPTAPNDIWDSVQWIAANVSALDADLTKGFVIGGGSAGGNLAIVTAHRSVKEKLSPPITGVLASIPVCMSKETVPEKYKDLWVSREQNAYAPGNPGLDSKSIGGCEAIYQQDFLSEDFSPFISTVPVSALPPTYIQAQGWTFSATTALYMQRLWETTALGWSLMLILACHTVILIYGRTWSSQSSLRRILFGMLDGLCRQIPRERVEEFVAVIRKWYVYCKYLNSMMNTA